MGKKCIQLFGGCFGAWLLVLLVGCVDGWQYNGPAAAMAALALGAVLVPAVRFAAPRVDALAKPQFRVLFCVPATVFLLLLCMLGRAMAVSLVMDMEVVYASLPDFLDDFVLTGDNAGYYMVCNNNLGLALLLAAFYKLAGVFGVVPGAAAGLTAGILFNAAMLFVTVLLLCLVAFRQTGRQSAPLLVLVLAMGFAPLYLWTPYFYSDTLCMPFLAGALLLFSFWQEKPRWDLMAGFGLCAFAGYAVKGSLVVLLVAGGILLLLAHPGKKQLAAGLLALLLGFALPLAGYKAWQQAWLDWPGSESYRYPIQLWFCYGSHGDGNYNQADVDAVNALATQAEKKAWLQNAIRENYAARTPLENLSFAYRKAVRTWGDGKYGADEILCWPLASNATSLFTLAGQPLYMPFAYYCQAVQYLLLLCTALGCVSCLRRPAADTALLARVSLLGVMLFLSLWETKARYALHFTPVLLLCTALFLLEASGWHKKAPRPAAEPPEKSA